MEASPAQRLGQFARAIGRQHHDGALMGAQRAEFGHAYLKVGEQFEQDLGKSQRQTYEKWKKRSVWERFVEWLGFVIEKQE